MSVYTDLLKLGLSDASASSLAEVVARPHPLTDALFSQRLAELETRLVRHSTTVMLSMTGIFAVFVALMTAILAWLVTLPRVA